MKACKHCGEINTNDSSYCCNCGHSKFILQEEIACAHCGVLNDKAYTHCINCGSDLKGNAAHETTHGEGTLPAEGQQEHMVLIDTGLNSVPSETARCPQCGTPLPITAIFCPSCGESVASLHTRRIVERQVCPHCGKLNKLDANLCTYCFSSLSHADTEELHVVHETENLGELIVRQSYLEGLGGKQLICPNCGTLNDRSEPFCISCGLKLEADAPKKYCPNCGMENPSDSAFCSKCRWSFEGETPDQIEKWTCSFCDHVNEQNDSFCPHCGQKRQK